MAFQVNITACLTDCCKVLEVSDVSGIQYILKNLITDSYTTGWYVNEGTDTGNPELSDITDATITITYPNGTTAVSDVLTDLQASHIDTFNGYFTFPQITPASGTSFSDGEYTIVYSVTDSVSTYTATITQLFYCQVSCCVSQMWKNLPAKYQTDGYEEYRDRCEKAESLLKILKTSASCSNTAAMAKVLSDLQEICEYNNCGCS